MSGDFQSRVNSAWDNATRANVAPCRWFWEWLHFINDHPGLTIIEVGNSGGSLGSTIPATWLAWDGTTDPLTLTPSLSANSWIVFEATNADPLLNGGGTMKWQAKLQYTNATAYNDPSATNYGQDGNTNRVVMRTNVKGGWVGSPTFDFVPGTSEQNSQDVIVQDGANIDFYLDIVGDDDTIFWRTAGLTNMLSDNPYLYSRGGYIGMITQRSADISYPFLFMAGSCSSAVAASGAYAINDKLTTNTYYQWRHTVGGGVMQWPSYSVAKDKTRVIAHMMETYHTDAISKMQTFHYTGEIILPFIRVAQWAATKYFNIIGELRLLACAGQSIGQGMLHGDDGEWLQFCRDPATHNGGISMNWPEGITPIW